MLLLVGALYQPPGWWEKHRPDVPSITRALAVGRWVWLGIIGLSTDDQRIERRVAMTSMCFFGPMSALSLALSFDHIAEG